MIEFKKRVQVTEEGVMYDVPVDDTLDILFSDLPKSQQYWRRQNDFPQFFFDYSPHLPDNELCILYAERTEYDSSGNKLISLSIPDTTELIRLVNRERRRMRDGIYIMNNGEKIYFTGPKYGVLQWCKMVGLKENDGYGEHRECQRILSYVYDMAKRIDKITGFYCHKIKKSGISNFVTLLILVESITCKKFTSATMSKVLATAKEANFQFYRYGLKNLPDVLRPMIEQKGWQNAAYRINLRCKHRELSMESSYSVVSTKSDSLDGYPSLTVVHLDEPPKFPKAAPIDQVFTKSKEQTRKQQVKYGFIIMTSYPPEEDTDAFRWCKALFEECLKLGNDGLPINGIIGCCINVMDGSTGTFDKYGFPDRFRALSEEKAARALLKNSADLQARKRQYMLNSKEGWEEGGGGSAFNNISLTEQEELIKESEGDRNYIEYDLDWSAGRLSKLIFRQITHDEIMAGKKGKWRMYCSMDYMKKYSNLCFDMPRKIKIIRREKVMLLQPPTDVIHPAGTDPVNYLYVSEGGAKQSKNASIVRDIEGNIISVYHFRSENPDDSLDDFCKEMLFWGTYSIVEGNQPNAVTTLENQGMYYFILIRHPNGEILPYNQSVNIKHISSTKDLKSKYIMLIHKRIDNSCYQIKDVPLIKDLKIFNAQKTQEHDLSVSFGLSEVAVDAMQDWMQQRKVKVDHYADMAKAMGAVMGMSI